MNTYIKGTKKTPAEELAEICARASINAGGNHPIDHKGNCVLPIYPLKEYWDYFYKEMRMRMNGGMVTEGHEQVFKDTFYEIMKEEIVKYQ